MYDFIRGKYGGIQKDYVIVDNHGMGYKVFTSGNTMASMPRVGDEVLLYLTQIVREDFIGLYGFSSREELDLFLVLITINGVGAKAALSLLSVSLPERLKAAIVGENETLLMKAPGIGKKTAQRIILELKHKLRLEHVEDLSREEREDLENENTLNEAMAALQSLGYTEKEAKTALKHVDKALGIEDIIKESLKHLMR